MNSDSEENNEVEVEVQEKPVKPKKVLSDAQLEVLRNARILAAERKKQIRKEKDEQLKQIKTKYKSKEKKKLDCELEEKPLKQQIELKEKEVKEEPPKEEPPKKQLKEIEEDLAKVAIKDEKPKKKKKKKPVVILHGSSSESSDDEQQVIYIPKRRSKPKQQKPPEPEPPSVTRQQPVSRTPHVNHSAIARSQLYHQMISRGF